MDVYIMWLSHDSLSTANLLLQDTIERIHVGKQYGDIPRGIYLVRGENVALCGEIVSCYYFETDSLIFCICPEILSGTE